MPWGAVRLICKYSFINFVLPQIAHNVPNKLVPVLHRLRGVKIGRGTFIDRSVIIDEAYPENVVIEDDVRVAAGTVIISHIRAGTHLRHQYLPVRVSRVRIGRYSFVGANVVILPGVTLEEGTVVVSGSVVMTSTSPYSVVSGNPAKKVKVLRKMASE